MRALLFWTFLAVSPTFIHAEEIAWDLQTARVRLSPQGSVAGVDFDGRQWPGNGRPAFLLTTTTGTLAPRAVRQAGGTLTVVFDDRHTATLAVTLHRGFALVRLVALTGADDVQRFRLFSLPAPADATVAGTLNAADDGQVAAAVMATRINVQAVFERDGALRGDRPGCTHQFLPSGDDPRVGRQAARFTAQADAKSGGWSMQGRMLPAPLNLTGLTAVRAWIHGDGQGQMLKIQLFDGQGGNRDCYVKIDFSGWRQVTISQSPLNTLHAEHVAGVNFYYNSLPPDKKVDCRLDQVEALVQRDGQEAAVVLEDFEAVDNPLWSRPGGSLIVQAYSKHGLMPADCAVIAVPREELLSTIQRVEEAAGLPSPKLDGVWNKVSPAVKRSYFFLTRFQESQFDAALAIARRGNFAAILLGQESWAHGTGHYQINPQAFPDGLEGLQRTVKRFQAAGFRVGLHFLGPSVYAPDPYLTPRPDPRLVKGATATLAASIDATADFLPLDAPPAAFPADDGGYEGSGTIVQIDDELIQYAQRTLADRPGLARCRRGHAGTKPAPHAPGAKVAHLVRAYGYHMFDMDTSLLDEVAGHFATVANACGIDMIYFDGSERLQGDHWYYNAKLHKAFYDKLAQRDILMQASSASHYSWHILARSASADGHGDLKGYLDERSPSLRYMAANHMPLDIGWYYGYDVRCPLDMYEYVLGATIGYDSSMSFQVSVDAAAKHPCTAGILDLIARYEELRLSGRVSPEMRQRLRIDPQLGGKKSAEDRAKLLPLRRDYRLVGPPGHEAFQRMIYPDWQAITDPQQSTLAWPVEVAGQPVRIGVEIHAESGPWLRSGPSYDDPQAVTLETFDNLRPYLRGGKGPEDLALIEHGQGGSTATGVTQQLSRVDGARSGRWAAVYSATSTLAGKGGWSMIGRTLPAAVDISRHKALGLWMRGDGQGGQFKLQLRDGRGAADYYIPNDYTGWRYHQLVRPAQDAIDYARVTHLNLYYNGLPGKTTVACGLDDIRALPAVDPQQLVDPVVEVAGREFGWKGTLTAGQYLVFWPGEAVRRYGPGLEIERLPQTSPDASLPPGRHTATFRAAGATTLAVRTRVILQPAEVFPVQKAP